MHESARDAWLGVVFFALVAVLVVFMARHIRKENERKARWNAEASLLMQSISNSASFTWDELHIESSNGRPVLVGTKVPQPGE